jgi:hypothetical protein
MIGILIIRQIKENRNIARYYDEKLRMSYFLLHIEIIPFHLGEM